jgi:hypothetical protein
VPSRCCSESQIPARSTADTPGTAAASKTPSNNAMCKPPVTPYGECTGVGRDTQSPDSGGVQARILRGPDRGPFTRVNPYHDPTSGKGSGADRSLSGADGRSSGADRSLSGADRSRSGADGRGSGADRSRSGADGRGSGADRSLSGADGRGSGADRSLSGADGRGSGTKKNGVRRLGRRFPFVSIRRLVGRKPACLALRGVRGAFWVGPMRVWLCSVSW